MPPEVYIRFEGPLRMDLKAKVKDKIWKREYVEIFSLLPLEKFNRGRVKSEEGEKKGGGETQVVSVDPADFLQLAASLRDIGQCGGMPSLWRDSVVACRLRYDEQFRQQMAVQPSLLWDHEDIGPTAMVMKLKTAQWTLVLKVVAKLIISPFYFSAKCQAGGAKLLKGVSPAIIPLHSCKLTPNSEVKSRSGIILSEDERLILNKISGWIHTGSFNDTRFASSAKDSKATILNPRKKYCTGDKLTIQIDMFDYLGNRKTYGGDFIRSRIFNPTLKAGASGVVEDFNNGTYHVHFTLFWEGKVYISLLLYHSSEAASALWKAKDNDYGLIAFVGTFVNKSQSIKSPCGFKLDSENEVCEYRPGKNVESFYCIKQDNFHCGSLTTLQSFNRDVSFLKSSEKPLFNRTTPASSNSSICKIGMESPFPSGFVLQNKWRPVFCKIPDFTTQDKMYACLKDKLVYLFGDSTVRQWFEHILQTFKGFKNFNLDRSGLKSKLFAANNEKNILLLFKKHSHPFIASRFYVVKDDLSMSDEIDQLPGGPHHVLIISIGQHFRPFPIQLFIRRVMNVHRAVERLFLRSPDTKVIIKAENTREINADMERFSDFHGYIQYLIVMEAFKDLPVAIVDAWDMTIAFNSHSVHPPEPVVRNQIYMLLSYMCS
ncbi:NXPE family member 1-like [Hyla sarda]|uniref:NXPE family member 1-like n=1 Tax=Hyla sarda TaxID=327740 RepID=UPI0024C23CCA|nr:NXPE family member 1-like [Hyla sarda]